MTERTSLLLIHLGDSQYEVHRLSTENRPIYQELPSRDVWTIGELTSTLRGLEWEIEDDQDEGPHRRLFLKRD